MNRKEYLNKYQKSWIKKRRESYFSDKSCVKCGLKENLELDHIDPSQKITHKIWSRNEKFRNEELAKCQPLCHDCHKEKTIVYLKEIFTGKDIVSLQKIPDESYKKVLLLNKEGLSLRKACKKVGISYSTFSSTKSQKKRIFK